MSQPGPEQCRAKPGFSAALSGFGSGERGRSTRGIKVGKRKTNSGSGYVRDQRGAHVLLGVFHPPFRNALMGFGSS